MTMDRQTIMETNRSLRNIKNELENLLEKGVITDEAYESIHASLPAETPLHGAGAAARSTAQLPTPATSATASPAPPSNAMANLNLQSNSPAPPSYAQTGPPSLPSRNPEKPILAHARALYHYHGADARDVAFERDDRIAIHEYMNADWWMGKNLRTGQEGIFPKTYVMVEDQQKSGYNSYAPPRPVYAPTPMQGYPAGPPPQQNPYNAGAPPMAVAEQGGGESSGGGGKGSEMATKFGKKLGNAAIFGAGATIGSNIVNSIF